MGELAHAPVPGAIGCTQLTEILHVAGVQLAGMLPKEFELATVYTAAVCTKAQSPGEARAFVQRLASAANAAARRQCGFES
jgi:molybdate transport system substrate-binding protein